MGATQIVHDHAGAPGAEEDSICFPQPTASARDHRDLIIEA